MFKKAKKYIALLALLALAVPIVAGNFAAIKFASAAAPNDFNITSLNTSIVNKVEYGQPFDVPTGTFATTVTKPSGQVITGASSVLADQLGTYEVQLKDNTGFGNYKYNVVCYYDGDYSMLVDGDAATIPSVWMPGDADIELPDAHMYFYDEDKEMLLEDTSQELNVSIVKPNGTKIEYTASYSGGNRVFTKDGTAFTSSATGGKKYIDTFKVTENDKGTWYFTYYCRLDGQTNIVTKSYRMQVQSNFESTKVPNVSIGAGPTTGSANTKVTIPTATVSDDYQDRVILNIKVTYVDANGTVRNVPRANVNISNGYVDKDMPYLKADNTPTASLSEAADAIFNNSEFVTFYPVGTSITSYTVTYEAQNQSQYYGINEKASVLRTLTFTISDTTAPVFLKTNSYKIPSQWGTNVFLSDGAGGETPLTGAGTNIEFPIPEVFDNVTASGDLRISFSLTDASGQRVAYFSNINGTVADSSSNRYVASENLKADNYFFFRHQDNADGRYSVNSEGNIIDSDNNNEVVGKDWQTQFNFDLWNPTYTNASRAGNYKVTYVAYDNATTSNRQTIEYTINFATGDFKDLIAPTISYVAPKTLAFTSSEDEQTISSVSVTDAGTSRVHNEYFIAFNAVTDYQGTALVDSATFDAIKGSSAALVELDPALGTNKIAYVNTGNNLEVTVTNIDKEKVSTNIELNKYIYVLMRSTDSVGNVSTLIKKINFVDATTNANTLGGIAMVDYSPVGEQPANTKLRGDLYVHGSYSFNFNSNDRNFVGFEVYVQRVMDVNGNALAKVEAPITNVSYETYSDNAAGENATIAMHVDNVRFTPTNTGIYAVIFRSFHISGAGAVKISYVEITAKTGGGGVITASALPETGELNSTFNLPTEFVTNLSDAFVVRSVTGGRSSLMYDRFTAQSQSGYEFSDYIATRQPSGTIIYDANFRPLSYAAGGNIPAENGGKYSMKVSDNQTPSIVLLDIMPTYIAADPNNNETIVDLPDIAATSLNGIVAKFECKVTDNNGSTVKVDPKMVGTEKDGNRFTFKAAVNGTYKVVYTATLNGNVATATYEIKFGNVVAPTFRIFDTNDTTLQVIGYINDNAINLGTTPSVKEGDTFLFGIIKADDTDSSGLTYKKTITAPSGNIVATVTSATLRDNGTPIVLSESGTYKIEYSVTDRFGFESRTFYDIVVTKTGGQDIQAIVTLTVVLIVVGVILIAGVVVYLVRFRKRSVR